MPSIYVDIDLDDFDDEDIRLEYEARGLGDKPSDSERHDRLREIRQLMLNNKHKEACDAMYDYIRDELGVAI